MNRAYTDGKVTFVHTEHFKARGALLPQWLGQKDHPRRRFGELARTLMFAPNDVFSSTSTDTMPQHDPMAYGITAYDSADNQGPKRNVVIT